jgi:tRNA pseudouridine38-40 synthase
VTDSRSDPTESASPETPVRCTWRLLIEYDGTAYAGWQWQPTGTTIQRLLEDALEKVLGGERVHVSGSGRTDAGVHALGQVASFTCSTPRLPHAIRLGLNCLLPRDMAVREARVAPEGFHACHGAVYKHYRYRILDTGERAPLRERFTWHWRGPLDVAVMAQAAPFLVGTHDFASFQGGRSDVKTTVRTLFSVDVNRRADEVWIDVAGSGFLRHMVRILVGTLVDVGRGVIPPERIGQILEAHDRCAAGRTAPACGLCLMEVRYVGDDPI